MKLRNTVEYFPHYASASQGATLNILQKRYGNDGYAGWFKLLETLASTENHTIICQDAMHQEFLADRLCLKGDDLLSFLDLLASMEAIDAELWGNKIIWCQHLVDNLSDVYTNRRRESPTRPTTDLQEPTPHLQSTHSKLGVGDKDPTNNKKSFGEFANVMLDDNEYSKLVEKFGEDGCKERIENISTSKESKGYKFKSDYATILAWDRKDSKGSSKPSDKDFTGGKYGHMVKK